MTLDEFAESLADSYAEHARATFATDMEGVLARAESPIEKMMGAALLYRLSNRRHYLVSRALGPLTVHKSTIYLASRTLGPGVHLTQQAEVGPFRADFMLTWVNEGYPPDHEPLERVDLVIECDGHDFHERTPEQAERDRSRDRWMLAEGFTVIRFTGAEIVRNPVACAFESVNHLVRLAGFQEGGAQ